MSEQAVPPEAEQKPVVAEPAKAADPAKLGEMLIALQEQVGKIQEALAMLVEAAQVAGKAEEKPVEPEAKPEAELEPKEEHKPEEKPVEEMSDEEVEKELEKVSAELETVAS